MSNPTYQEGAVVVFFKNSTTEEQARQLINSFALTAEGEFGKIIKMLLVNVPVGEEMKWVDEFNKRLDVVEVAELNIKYHTCKE